MDCAVFCKSAQHQLPFDFTISVHVVKNTGVVPSAYITRTIEARKGV
ncbi:MAG: hypothetical protein KDA96_29505 [Planctomycetaceae bacterium]|nr:hypothetical protein [Planctomycetaceae bacterium]